MTETELARLRELEVENAALRAELERYRTWMPPGHYHSPIPSPSAIEDCLTRLRRDFPPTHVPGIDLNLEHQTDLFFRLAQWYGEEPFDFEPREGRRYFANNPFYGYADGFFLYAMMRLLAPKRVIEVGSGFSSCLMLDVDDAVLDSTVDFTFIEPHPGRLLELLAPGDLERTRLIRRPVQEVPLEEFRRLEADDILFIDSSHVAKAGSDVSFLVFEVFPLLQRGVFVHIHDVFYPFEYPEEWLREGRAWNESYLLRAFLQYNFVFSIELFTTQLAFANWPYGERLVPRLMKSIGGSIWIRRR